ncbi:MAG: hypothetical protein GXO15_06675 [Crenarchaeota archaeon]|nr:hypothetical protein [Thermoproteota archaeon]
MVGSGRLLREPPRIKALEAAAAVAEGRVERLSSSCFRVRSSDGSRVYTVYVDPGRGLAYSSDNGTRLRGYKGYPIIAALILQGLVPYDPQVGEALRGVPWRSLNERLKSYRRVLEEVKRRARARGLPPERLEEYMDRVAEALRRISLRLLPQPPLECTARRGEEPA